MLWRVSGRPNWGATASHSSRTVSASTTWQPTPTYLWRAARATPSAHDARRWRFAIRPSRAIGGPRMFATTSSVYDPSHYNTGSVFPYLANFAVLALYRHGAVRRSPAHARVAGGARLLRWSGLRPRTLAGRSRAHALTRSPASDLQLGHHRAGRARGDLGSRRSMPPRAGSYYTPACHPIGNVHASTDYGSAEPACRSSTSAYAARDCAA